MGLNNNNKKILKEAKKGNVPIITKFKKEYEPLFKEDIKASLVYSILTNYDVKKDYASSIIKK